MTADLPRFRRVLYVDDNHDAADTADMLLGLLGFESQACYDGPTALAVAAWFEPGVCVLDLNMPGMDGDELAVKLTARAKEPPLLVALTAMSNDESRQRTAAAGFHFHLVKPADLGALTTILGGRWTRTGVLPPVLTAPK